MLFKDFLIDNRSCIINTIRKFSKTWNIFNFNPLIKIKKLKNIIANLKNFDTYLIWKRSIKYNKVLVNPTKRNESTRLILEFFKQVQEKIKEMKGFIVMDN